MGCRFRNKYVSEMNGKVIFICENEECRFVFCSGEDVCDLEKVDSCNRR